MTIPQEKGTFTITLHDQNLKLLTGSTVRITESNFGSPAYDLIESAARPGT
jgi:hypothetical protein